MKILIIEDELPMRTALVETLRAEGYRTAAAANGPDGLAKALSEEPDLIVLDVMMPGLDGYALCRELRQRGRTTPVLMLTAKGLVDDRVEGLDAGADDYLVKPFAMKELFARVRALLRRQESKAAAPRTLAFGDVEIDFTRMTCRRAGTPVPLSAREFAMLRLLAQQFGTPISRDTFLDVVWEYNAYPTTRTVDNHIAALRAKLEPQPDRPRFIETVRGVGYRLSGKITNPLPPENQASP